MSRNKSPLWVLISTARFGKFASVGAVGAACDTIILLFLVEKIGLLEEIAVLVGIEASILVMFMLNDNWTYSTTDKTQTLLRRLLRSHAVRIVGALTQLVVFTLIYRSYFVQLELIGVDIWLLVAKATGIGFGMILNYVFESIFTWSIHKDY